MKLKGGTFRRIWKRLVEEATYSLLLDISFSPISNLIIGMFIFVLVMVLLISLLALCLNIDHSLLFLVECETVNLNSIIQKG